MTRTGNEDTTDLDEQVYVGETIEDAGLIAESENCNLIVAKPNELLLDYDQAEMPIEYYRMLPLVKKLFGVAGIERWSSRGGNCHVRIRLWVSKLDWGQRIALQAAMGSDPVKEMIALSRGHFKIREEPVVLFQPKGAKVEVLEKEPEPLADMGEF
jgi:hypothetical protein